MSRDASKTATIAILAKCLVRHLEAQRAQVLHRVEAKDRNWDKTQDDSAALEQVDEALTRLGHFDTKEPPRE